MLSVVMLNGIGLSVVAPFACLTGNHETNSEGAFT